MNESQLMSCKCNQSLKLETLFGYNDSILIHHWRNYLGWSKKFRKSDFFSENRTNSEILYLSIRNCFHYYLGWSKQLRMSEILVRNSNNCSIEVIDKSTSMAGTKSMNRSLQYRSKVRKSLKNNFNGTETLQSGKTQVRERNFVIQNLKYNFYVIQNVFE